MILEEIFYSLKHTEAKIIPKVIILMFTYKVDSKMYYFVKTQAFFPGKTFYYKLQIRFTHNRLFD